MRRGGYRGEYREAARPFAEAVIGSVDLIVQPDMSAIPPKADIDGRSPDVRFVPLGDIASRPRDVRFTAIPNSETQTWSPVS
jgi:hypothetical protein